MGVSKEREKDLAFSSLIDTFPISYFVRTEHGGINADPGIHTVGVIRGSIAFEKLKDRSYLRLVLYEEYPHGLFDLLAGKIEAFACPGPTLWQLARETGVEGHIKVVDRPVAAITRAIAVRKSDRALLDRLNSAIDGYVGTPDYQQVHAKWHGSPVPFWTTDRISAVVAAVFTVIIIVLAVWRYRSLLRLNRELSTAIAERDEAVSVTTRNKERFESLVNISQQRSENTQVLLDFALEEAIRLTRSRIGYIYFYSEDKQEFTLNTWSREVMNECKISDAETTYQLDRTGIWGEAVRQRKPIMVQDFHAPHPLKKGYPEGHAPLKRFLTVPVFHEGRIVSVVGVANKEAPYDQDDISQLTLLMDAVWRMVELKRSESALRENEAVLRSFLNAITESALLIDRQGRILAANETVARRLGKTAGELVGSNAYDILPPDVARRRQKHQEAVFRTGVPARFEDERFGMIIDNSVYPVFDQSGSVSAVAIVGVDITERKLAEQERTKLIVELQRAFAEIKTLHGILPICSSCKKIRDDTGAWHQMEAYIRDHTDAEFSHGLCLDCAKKLYPEYMNKKG